MEESAIHDILTAERSAVVARVVAMESDLEGIVANSENANADDEHDPEGSTIAYERAQLIALIAGARSNLEDLDLAMARLSAGSYSLCEVCGTEIAPERLAARPAVRTCIGCAAAR
jgi:RNA polymerase-binding transcription factor DksA